jgi:hypothetical protein
MGLRDTPNGVIMFGAMNLKLHWDALDRAERESLASACGTTHGHLRNVAYGYRACAPGLAAALEIETGRKLRRWDLRPLDWNRNWPELVTAEGAPPVPAAPAAEQQEAA